MGYRNFRGDRESKGSCDRENVGDGIHKAFITPIRQTTTRYEKQYEERKGRVPNNGDIGIEPDAGMAAQTQFNAGRVSATQQLPGIRGTQ